MKANFDSDYKNKILHISFEKNTKINSEKESKELKRQWMESLTSWHSPYKACIDCTNLDLLDEDSIKEIESTLSFFKKFFLKKTIGWTSTKKIIKNMPFEVFSTKEEALIKLGMREKLTNTKDDFRAQVHLENYFEQQVVEISFEREFELDKTKLAIIKSKLINNLMQWHSKWSLIIDCKNIIIPKELFADFNALIKFLSGFFLDKIVGYNNNYKNYPFKIFRSRHRAAALLKDEVKTSGRTANCQERKK